MADFEILRPDPVYGSNANFDDDGNLIRSFQEDVSLSSEDRICFKCPLEDCVEEAKNGCVIELRSNAKKISSYEDQIRKGTITESGKRKLDYLRKWDEMGWEKFKEGVAKKIGATYIKTVNVE